jgi:hypothetical protein
MDALNVDPSLLEDLSLELGASIHRPNGSVFNSSGAKGGYRLPKRQPVSDVPERITPPVTAEGNAALAKVLAEFVDKINIPAPSAPVVNVPEPSVVFQPTARVSWRFEFERNPDKTLKAITATPT